MYKLSFQNLQEKTIRLAFWHEFNMMCGMETESVEQAIGRIMKALDLRHKTDLARILSVSHAAIYSAIHKGNIPQRWLTKLARGYNLNPNWIVTGKAPMKIGGLRPAPLLPPNSEEQRDNVLELQRENVLLEDVRAAVDSFAEQLKKHDLVIEDMNEDKKMKWIMFCHKILLKEDAAGIPRGTVEEEVHRIMGSILL